MQSDNTTTPEQAPVKAKAADNRFRNWVMLVYPESAPSNWNDILDEKAIPWVCSPLHDSDLWTTEDEGANPEHKAGTPKKPHWHVALKFSGKVGRERVNRIAQELNAPLPKPIGDWRGMIRYFCHLDSPDKHLYDPALIECHCGADVSECLDATLAEERCILNELEDMIIDQQLTEFWRLVDAYRADETRRRIIREHSYHLQGLIKSVRHYKRQQLMEG